MKRFVFALCLIVGALHSSAATAPIYINSAPVISPPDLAPQIDATVFVNQSIFSYNYLTFNPLPYQTLNTRFFTNRASGRMASQPGFRFDFSTNNVRLPMDSWVNNGSISVESPLSFFTILNSTAFAVTPPGNWLMVSASNIVSTGTLNAGELGLVRLEGNNIDLRNNGIRTGPPLTNNFIFGGGYLGLSNYFNDFGVTDVYWGAGTNNALNSSRGMLMPLNGFSPSFSLPFPQSPTHEVVTPSVLGGFFFTNLVSLPSFISSFNATYGAFVYTNLLSPTNRFVQVVYVPTNYFDTNFSASVRFFPDGDPGATVIVSFNSIDTDIVTQTTTTNSVYLVDALAGETNNFLARNYTGGTRRPANYEVTRGEPFLFSFFGSSPGNAVYDDSLLFNPSFLSNSVRVLYSGYSAQVSSRTVNPGLVNPALNDPTNFAGRVEIFGDVVNLDRTRIRADSTLIIKARDLTSNRLARVDAPFLVLDLGSSQPEMVISNVAPTGVRRLAGTISAWSGVWRNFEVSPLGTNTVDFHVLIVDPNFQGLQGVVINELKLRGNNIRIADPLQIGKTLIIDAVGLHITGGLNFPFSSSYGGTNIQRVLNFTNDGAIFVPGLANYGADREVAYDNFINRGTNTASAQFVRAINFENSGVLASSGGAVTIDANVAQFLGPTLSIGTNITTNIFFDIFGFRYTNFFTNTVITGSKIESDSDIEIRAGTLIASNTFFRAGGQAQGSLIVNVTNVLFDGGVGTTNDWHTSAGFQMVRRPATSDLLQTRLTTVALAFNDSFNSWAAEDRGPTAAGFDNNLALGTLIIDGANSSLFHFDPVSGVNALYVDFLDFRNVATNFDSPGVIEIDPNFTIYFANASVPAEKLDGAANGRFRWVSEFAGPNSSTQITYPSGITYTFNAGLIASKDLDSDGDGIVNAEDPTPIFVAESAALSITLEDMPGSTAMLSWNALASSTNYLEFKTSFGSSDWQTVTNFVQGSITRRVQMSTQIPAGEARIYRVRFEPGK